MSSHRSIVEGIKFFFSSFCGCDIDVKLTQCKEAEAFLQNVMFTPHWSKISRRKISGRKYLDVNFCFSLSTTLCLCLLLLNEGNRQKIYLCSDLS